MIPQVTFLLCWTSVIANQFSPHVFPTTGPFFEGWYMRVIDPEQGLSIGLLFGHVEPASNSTDPPVVASLLFSRGCPTCKLLSYDAFFQTSQLRLTVNGHPVKSNPDDTSPAVFEWTLGKNITFTTRGNVTKFAFYIGGASFQGTVASPVPWGPGGEGPEGFVQDWPLPLHWFVYSLRSQVDSYEFAIPSEGVFYSGYNAVAHVEKNWGESFPPAWIWAEGVKLETDVTLSLTGGLLPLDIATVPLYLIGYWNPDKNLVLTFKPWNSLVKTVHDGCSGFVNVSVTSFEHQVEIHIASDLGAFSDCLYGPEKSGFRPVCVESYNAVATVTVYRFGSVIDEQTIPYFALEFGGQYVCNEKCTGSIYRDP